MFSINTVRSSARCSLASIIIGLSIFAIQPNALAQTKAAEAIFDVRDYGAVGDGVTLDTKAIQSAVDACAQSGGGKVYLHSGSFLSGTIYLKSNVTLYIEAGAILLGSTDLKDFPVTVAEYRSYTDNYTDKSLIYAEKAENISIMGRGVIDGQGGSPSFKFGRPSRDYYKKRPYMIRIIECTNVFVRDVTIQNSPMWVQHYLACDNVLIDGITVRSKVNQNNDGIDIDCCSNVRISNCDVDSGDDAIVLKSTADRPCRNVTITNCVLSSYANALKMGTESNGGFQNITISNCTLYDTRGSGIALELVDGGVFDRVSVSNITMDNVRSAIFIRLGNRARPFTAKGPGGSRGTFTAKEGSAKPGMGSMSNIIISNVQATGVSKVGCSITGLPDFPVENVTLENIRIRYEGGGSLEDAAREVPEKAEAYPEYGMFGTLPAYGFFVRHVKNVRFNRVDLEFADADRRPALVFDDVDGAVLDQFKAQRAAGNKYDVRLLDNVRNFSVLDSRGIKVKK